MMHKEQLRAARALIGWSQEELASTSGVSLPTIKRIESGMGPLKASKDVLEKIENTLYAQGVEILGSDEGGGFGVRIVTMDESDRLLKCHDHVRMALTAARLALGFANSELLRADIDVAISKLSSALYTIDMELMNDIPDIPE